MLHYREIWLVKLFYLLYTDINSFCSSFSSADKQVKPLDHNAKSIAAHKRLNLFRSQELLMSVDMQWKSHYWLLSLLGHSEREGLHMLTPDLPVTPNTWALQVSMNTLITQSLTCGLTWGWGKRVTSNQPIYMNEWVLTPSHPAMLIDHICPE